MQFESAHTPLIGNVVPELRSSRTNAGQEGAEKAGAARATAAEAILPFLLRDVPGLGQVLLMLLMLLLMLLLLLLVFHCDGGPGDSVKDAAWVMQVGNAGPAAVE
jgi:hypothetical protein